MSKKVRRNLLVMLSLVICLSQVSVFAFNANNAISYANLYADTPNPEYNHYGADCTNYVSQILYAGGLAQDSTWYSKVHWNGNNSVHVDSVAWKNSDEFKNHIKARSGVTKIGQWSKTAMTNPFVTYKYVNNSSNLTSNNAGRVVIFFDWNADNKMDHSTFYVVNNGASRYKYYSVGFDEGTGDLINQHSNNRKQVLWRPDYRQARDPLQYDDILTTRVHAFQIPN